MDKPGSRLVRQEKENKKAPASNAKTRQTAGANDLYVRPLHARNNVVRHCSPPQGNRTLGKQPRLQRASNTRLASERYSNDTRYKGKGD